MLEHKIQFLLIQIDEAHSTAWPVGLPNTPIPQKSFSERVTRANNFVKSDNPPEPFKVYIDNWDNNFAETFRAWPDKYYFVDKSKTILQKSEYGHEGDQDALIIEDCVVLMQRLII